MREKFSEIYKTGKGIQIKRNRDKIKTLTILHLSMMITSRIKVKTAAINKCVWCEDNNCSYRYNTIIPNMNANINNLLIPYTISSKIKHGDYKSIEPKEVTRQLTENMCNI